MARRSPGGTFSGRASSQSSFTSGYDGAGAAGAGPLRKMPPIPCPLNGSSRVPGGQRALEQRLLGSPQPLASSWSSCTNGGAQNHPGTTWKPPLQPRSGPERGCWQQEGSSNFYWRIHVL